MNTQNTINAQPAGQPPSGALPAGSAPSSVITASLTGVQLQPVNRQRMLKTGDRLSNIHGQFLWEVFAFHPEGLRVIEPMTGICKDWKWETIYTFYERVEPSLQNQENSQSRPKS